jgi:protein-S-isoprenylcysteine O-methyltransferase Ste14
MSRLFDLIQLIALACFLAMFLGRTIQLYWTRGIQVLTLGRGKPPVQAALEYLLVVGLPLWVYEVAAYAAPLPFHLSPPPLDALLVDSIAAKVLGSASLAAGLVIFGLALGAFGESWRVGIDRRTPGALVTGGVFSRSRNPIFLFMDLYLAGTFLLNGRLIFLLFALLAAGGLHFQIRQEERFLEQTHGAAYRDYCARVSRYWGWGAPAGERAWFQARPPRVRP